MLFPISNIQQSAFPGTLRKIKLWESWCRKQSFPEDYKPDFSRSRFTDSFELYRAENYLDRVFKVQIDIIDKSLGWSFQVEISEQIEISYSSCFKWILSSTNSSVE